jgi:hypothetical protein
MIYRYTFYYINEYQLIKNVKVKNYRTLGGNIPNFRGRSTELEVLKYRT